MIELEKTPPPVIDRFQRTALIAGIVGLVITAVGAVIDYEQFFRSFLLGFIFWIGITLGCLAILMVQHMSGGAWGLVIRRLLEAATRTLPLLAILFIAIIAGIRPLYEWARPETIANAEIRELVEHKHLYLNIPFFIGRAVFYFAVWFGLAFLLNRYSLEQDRTAYRPLTRKMQIVSGPGILLYGLTVTFASVDWVMSLRPEWFSTIFGILFMGGQGLSAMAFIIAVIVLLSNYKPLSDVVQPSHLHDLGKLMLAFLMLWAYFAFSQFLIIWSGNIPEEVTWYTDRFGSAWQYVGIALVLIHFALPFLLLLSRDLKRNSKMLSRVAMVIIVMRFVDLIWMTGPEFHRGHFAFHWLDIVAPIGIGGVWLAYFAYQLKQRPLVPVGDPYLEEAMAHTGGH